MTVDFVFRSYTCDTYIEVETKSMRIVNTFHMFPIIRLHNPKHDLFDIFFRGKTHDFNHLLHLSFVSAEKNTINGFFRSPYRVSIILEPFCIILQFMCQLQNVLENVHADLNCFPPIFHLAFSATITEFSIFHTCIRYNLTNTITNLIHLSNASENTIEMCIQEFSNKFKHTPSYTMCIGCHFRTYYISSKIVFPLLVLFCVLF